MIKNYILKHKNISVAKFKLDTDDFEVLSITNIIDEKRLPFLLKSENKLNSCLLELNKWISYRGISESRIDYIDILHGMKAGNNKELSVTSLALNL